MVIAIINNKGGTGKTTTSINLSAALTLAGFRVLLIDLDPQASASMSLGLGWSELTPSAAAFLFNHIPLKDIILSSPVSRMDLISADPDMASSDLLLADYPGRENILAQSLRTVQGEYDFVFLDCPPSLSMLSVNALMAADAYIVPLTPEYLALEGLINMTHAVKRMALGMGMKARLMGILFTLVNPALKSARQVMSLVEDHFKETVFKTRIPRDVRLGDAPSFSQSIFSFAPKSRGAEAYGLLAGEVIERTKKQTDE